MPNQEIEFKPVGFITVGTVGPKGKRLFHLQAGDSDSSQVVSLIIEKEQANALGEAIRELLDDLDKRFPENDAPATGSLNMDLRDPIEPLFRVSQMGLGYDEKQDMIVLVVQELMLDSDDDDDGGEEEAEPSVVRLWCSRSQMRTLSDHAQEMVKQGRPDPKQNGRLVFYWT
jgi:uncharacterized repeat protein (TIGR03847 family)